MMPFAAKRSPMNGLKNALIFTGLALLMMMIIVRAPVW